MINSQNRLQNERKKTSRVSVKGVASKRAARLDSCGSASSCTNARQILNGGGENAHPDHAPSRARLRRAVGQINGIERMIAERRYCVDILVQFRAVSAALKAAEASILERHVRGCVSGAFSASNKVEVNKKVEELVALFTRG